MIKNELNDRLCDALLSLETREECYAFLEDLLTMSEWNAMAQRLEVARQLTGDVTYMDICANTGASTATISRVKSACIMVPAAISWCWNAPKRTKYDHAT